MTTADETKVTTAAQALELIERRRDALRDQVEALQAGFAKNPDPTLGDQLELTIASQKWGRAFNDAMDAGRLIAKKGEAALAMIIDAGLLPASN